MKKVAAFLATGFLTLLLPVTVFAQTTTPQSINPCPPGTDTSVNTICASANLQIGETIGLVIQFLFIIATVLALGFLVYGGIKWITSGGDKGGVESARNMIIAAIIGLIVVFLAYVVLNLVLTFLTGSGIDAIKIPTLQ